ncbi:hypothetical protein Q9Q95_11860 [Sphingomonas sp. DG1-23]|uniref:DUF6683 family protein n=1 Tax=Sphingomonas sp. DG1-23 TaxID=3068316 RepID=UPI00273F2CE5|nr:DUF6683 family protein [Sphingomonas sp. DG1-23]MDP5279618.1 hypothetical protein [Sphingomonas sp. DG1-23]
MHRPGPLARTFVLASALALAAPAAAQDGVDWGGLMSGIAHGTAMDEAAQESVSVNRRGSGRVRVAPAPTARLTYKPSIERRRANFAQFVAKTRKKDPEGAALLEKELASSDVIAKMGRALSAYGMRTDNVADAYAAWWLNAWLASRQRTDTPPARQIAAVRAQAARAMASLPEMANASDAVKQEMAEANLIQTALIGAYLEHAKNDRALLRKIASAVRQGARASGLNLDGMDLTDDGFVGGSVGAAENEADQQAAAGPEGNAQVAAAREEGSDTTVVYAAAAAAAAGLIGGIWLARGRKSGADRHG